MPKSDFAEAVDRMQAALRPFLKENGFRVRGRTFNRETDDGLTQVVNIQMGASDPPGTTYFPGLRENLHGLFTANLGVYVPEVAEHHGSRAGSWVQAHHCCIRTRLGEASGAETDLWWPADADETVVADVLNRLRLGGLPFLDRFATRERILAGFVQMTAGCSPPRIVRAVILAGRGKREEARQLLSQQVGESADHPGHQEYVRELAARLDVGSLD